VKITEKENRYSIRTGVHSGLRRVYSWLGKDFSSIIVFLVCVVLYYVVIARRYFGTDVIGGDTHLIWSMHYFVMKSLIEYLQYPLWDPTTLGGYPSHLLMVNGWFQNFHPFHLPFLLIAAAVGKIFHIDANYLMVFHKTIYVFSLNLVAVMLITREICESRLARLLPPLVYTLCYFQFYALRDSLLVEGLPPALFFVFGLLYHANRRTPFSLAVFLIFLALWIAGFSYAYLLASVWWVGTLTILILLFSPGLLPDSWNCCRQLWAGRTSRLYLLLVSALVVLAVGVVAVSVSASVGEVIRAVGDKPVDYDVSAGGQFAPRSIFTAPVWTNFLVWAPFPDIHTNFLKFDPWDAGVHHRYVGMALLPLLIIAALFGHRRRYAWPFMLTAFVATAFVAYGPNNPFFTLLLDNVPAIRNTRPMAYLLPRDATLLLVFAAGIGLDIVLRSDFGEADTRLWGTARFLLVLLLVVAGGMLVASAVPALESIRHSLAHMAVYLGLSGGIVLVLMHGLSPQHQRGLMLALLATTGMDLSLSAAAYAKLPHTWGPRLASQYISMPSSSLGPMKPGDLPWVGGAYRGQMHRLYGGPYVGTRTWLVLATHPSWQPVLQNWSAAGRYMTAYPAFRFFSNGTYVPFEAIRDIDKVKLPAYVNEPPTLLIRSAGGELIRFPDRDVPVEKGLVGFIERASLSPRTVLFSGWAIDEKAGRPVREILIFVGDTLWSAFGTGVERPDIAGFGKNFTLSGFDALLDGLPAAERKSVRGFALLADGTARELQYSEGYPFARDDAPGQERLRGGTADGPPTIYLHDKNAVASDVPGREEALSWSIVGWTPNHYTARVVAPSDGYLLNLENYSPYWKVRVDGKSQDILRANFTMQAIKLAKGEHIVEWRYDPLRFKLGWLAFYVLFFAVLIVFVRLGASRNRPVGSP
jgi:hypothetical protein